MAPHKNKPKQTHIHTQASARSQRYSETKSKTCIHCGTPPINNHFACPLDVNGNNTIPMLTCIVLRMSITIRIHSCCVSCTYFGRILSARQVYKLLHFAHISPSPTLSHSFSVSTLHSLTDGDLYRTAMLFGYGRLNHSMRLRTRRILSTINTHTHTDGESDTYARADTHGNLFTQL